MTIDQDSGEILTAIPKSQRVFVRTPFNYDRELASLLSGLSCDDPTRTQQQFGEECDINTIVERFGLTGELPSNLRVPMQGEFEDSIDDYQTALNKLMEADDAFMQMPAKIRERFHHDAGEFVEYVSDPANKKQCQDWGLAAPETAPPAPIMVKVIPDPSPDLKTAP